MTLYNGARDVVGRAYSHDHAMAKVLGEYKHEELHERHGSEG